MCCQHGLLLDQQLQVFHSHQMGQKNGWCNVEVVVTFMVLPRASFFFLEGFWASPEQDSSRFFWKKTAFDARHKQKRTSKTGSLLTIATNRTVAVSSEIDDTASLSPLPEMPFSLWASDFPDFQGPREDLPVLEELNREGIWCHARRSNGKRTRVWSYSETVFRRKDHFCFFQRKTISQSRWCHVRGKLSLLCFKLLCVVQFWYA